MVGTVGRLTYQKAPQDFLEALRRLGRPGVTGVWIGGGELAERVARLAAISSRLVQMMGGRLEVESAPGKGASFQIFLPRIEEVVTPVAESKSPAATLQGTETVLLVEDADALRKLARSFLLEHGFNVLVASNGEEAVQVAKNHNERIHLLLTDVVMPGMNGRALSDHLHPNRPDMKVLYMSGYTDSFIAGHGVLEEGMHLLHKPFTEDVLIGKIREVLDEKEVRVRTPVLQS